MLPVDIDAFFNQALDKASIGLLPLTPVIAARAAALPDIHKDPIDRVIIATSIEHGADLIAKDKTVRSYPDVVTRWED